MALSIDIVTATLPDGFDALRAEARNEGHHSLDRLATDWSDGTARFSQQGEVLLAVHSGDVLVGIGGLTHDPFVPNALRMRRFYVHPGFRRLGVGRTLATALLARPSSTGRTVTVNAGTAQAPAFWAALGFIADPRDGHTHRRCLAGLPGAG